MSGKSYTVGEVARLAHVTVRTLHHYDEIGLLAPSARSESGYRLYDDADLERLHQILLFRELEFPLDAVRRVLDDHGFDRRTALKAQRDLLVRKVRKTETLIRAVDETLEKLEGGDEMDMAAMFDGFDPSEYEEEARERWGETDAYKESLRRTRSYTKRDWETIKAEADEIVARMAELLAAGHRPEAEEATDAAERHRLHIDRWFYPCSRAMHGGLADMYVADSRFGEYFESRAEGLTEFVAAAIHANAARAA